VARVFVDDYPARDDTGVRDYTHVIDVAEGQVTALLALAPPEFAGLHAWNLGTGLSYSVPDVMQAFEFASGQRQYPQGYSRADADAETTQLV
jgi:UDP-glucose 4-epimerase